MPQIVMNKKIRILLKTFCVITVLSVVAIIYVNFIMSNVVLHIANHQAPVNFKILIAADTSEFSEAFSDSITSAVHTNDEITIRIRRSPYKDYTMQLKINNGSHTHEAKVKHLKYGFVYITLNAPGDAIEDRVVVNAFTTKSIKEAIKKGYLFYSN